MPSPVAHSLIGLTIGLAWLAPRAPLREWPAKVWALRWPLVGALFVANAPDLDYLPGIAIGELNAFHHTYTHTLAFIVAVALLMALAYRRHARAGGWLFALGASHLAADVVTEDRRAPFGIMALWPFSPEYWISPVSVFWHLRKREWGDMLQWHNAHAVLVEIAWCLPLVLLMIYWKTRCSSLTPET
mgnify:CR=1 FL=1